MTVKSTYLCEILNATAVFGAGHVYMFLIGHVYMLFSFFFFFFLSDAEETCGQKCNELV